MVMKYGMSDKMGPITFGENSDEVFLGKGMATGGGRNYSEEVASQIDDEVRQIIGEAYVTCERILREHMDKLDKVANTFLEKEKIDGDEFSAELSSSFHKTIKKVSEDIETLKYNTAIAALMTLLNAVYNKGAINKAELKALLLLVNPFAPHVTEEINEAVFGDGLLAIAQWPSYDEAKCVDDTIEIVVQVNGKVRAKLNVAAEISSEDAIAAAKADEKIADEIAGKTVIKELYVKGRLVNIVVK
jgi:leucyl-tRNA synthetase